MEHRIVMKPLMLAVLGILVAELVLLMALFVRYAHQYYRVKSYTNYRYPEVWRAYCDSGRLTRWISTNMRDHDILRQAASADSHLEGLLRVLDTIGSRYIKTFLLAIASFVCAAISLPFIAK